MISIEEARKILWRDYDCLSDEQIQKIIDLFVSIGYILIEKYKEEDSH